MPAASAISSPHPANIELSKESIALFADFEEDVGHPIDFWPDGYLFLLSSASRASAPSEQTSLCNARMASASIG